MRRIWTARRSRRPTRSAAQRSTAARSASPPDRGSGCGGGELRSNGMARAPRGAGEPAARRLPLIAASAVGAEPRLQPRYAEVVLPVPVSRNYTYQIPFELEDRVVPGARVIVPLQRRQVVGIVAAVDAPAPAVATKPILRAPDAE